MEETNQDEDSTFKIDDNGEFDSAVSREELIRDELSGSISILPSNGVKSKEKQKKSQRKCSYCVIIGLTVFVFLLGLILLIVGIVLITKKPTCEKSGYDGYAKLCQPTSEAKDRGLYKFVNKVQNLYYETFPNKIPYKRPVSVDEIRQKFKIYDESPSAKKKLTDECSELLKEVEGLKIDRMKLSPRESKALSQIMHVLKYGMGYTYSTNYYAGDYMLLPNLWCFSVPICDIGDDLKSGLRYLKPHTFKDMQMLRDRLKTVQSAFNQLVDNLKYGVTAGMVPPIEACHAGINGVRTKYKHIADNGELGVFKEPFMEDILHENFLSSLTANFNEARRWQEKYGKSANESLKEFIMEYVGQPIHELFRYIKGEYLSHCVPSNVSSGLASLPLDYVYTNSTADISKPATKKLPTGEVLDGKKTYTRLVGSYTTNKMTPEEIYNLGIEMTDRLYPQMLEIAKKITGESDNTTAIEALLKRLNSSEMYYNKEPFPANESDQNAYKQCSNEQDAMKNCPVRWRAIQEYFAEVSMFNSLLDPKTVSMFHFTGRKYSVPNCPLALTPDFNPSAALSYREGDPLCLRTASFRLPFFQRRMGPRWLLVSFCGHEGRPGHHTQLQGYLERFRDTCGDVMTWLDKIAMYWGFLEGWGLYAENPLVAKETDVYKTRPLGKYGMLNAQISRSLRLVLDTGLHFKGMTRSQANDILHKYTWSKTSQSAITRYQSVFGQATPYTIGQLHILKLRDRAKKELGSKFKLQDFHYYMLSTGTSPLGHFDEVIDQYISCTKNSKQTGCDVILNPPIRPERAGEDVGVEGDNEFYFDPPQQPKRTIYY